MWFLRILWYLFHIILSKFIESIFNSISQERNIASVGIQSWKRSRVREIRD